MGVICCICVCCHSIHFCVGNSAGCYVSWICGNVCGNDRVSCVLGSDVCLGDKVVVVSAGAVMSVRGVGVFVVIVAEVLSVGVVRWVVVSFGVVVGVAVSVSVLVKVLSVGVAVTVWVVGEAVTVSVAVVSVLV